MLISIEGIDGAGKSTAIEYICSRLNEHDIIKLSFPSNKHYGSQIRKALDNGSLSDIQMKDLFIKDFAQVNESIIKPELKKGKTIICDRYIDSFIAYQSAILNDEEVGRELDFTLLKNHI